MTSDDASIGLSEFVAWIQRRRGDCERNITRGHQTKNARNQLEMLNSVIAKLMMVREIQHHATVQINNRGHWGDWLHDEDSGPTIAVVGKLVNTSDRSFEEARDIVAEQWMEFAGNGDPTTSWECDHVVMEISAAPRSSAKKSECTSITEESLAKWMFERLTDVTKVRQLQPTIVDDSFKLGWLEAYKEIASYLFAKQDREPGRAVPLGDSPTEPQSLKGAPSAHTLASFTNNLLNMIDGRIAKIDRTIRHMRSQRHFRNEKVEAERKAHRQMLCEIRDWVETQQDRDGWDTLQGEAVDGGCCNNTSTPLEDRPVGNDCADSGGTNPVQSSPVTPLYDKLVESLKRQVNAADNRRLKAEAELKMLRRRVAEGDEKIVKLYAQRAGLIKTLEQQGHVFGNRDGQGAPAGNAGEEAEVVASLSAEPTSGEHLTPSPVTPSERWLSEHTDPALVAEIRRELEGAQYITRAELVEALRAPINRDDWACLADLADRLEGDGE